MVEAWGDWEVELEGMTTRTLIKANIESFEEQKS